MELRDREDEVVGADPEDPLPDQLGRVNEIVVKVHRGLGRARRARRIAPERDVVPARVGGGKLGRRALEQPLIGERAAARPADGDHRGEPRTLRADGQDRLGGPLARHHGAGPAIVQDEGVLVGAERLAHGHRDGAELHRAPERLRELRAIGQREQHALLDGDAARPQRIAEPIGPPSHLFVRHGTAGEAKRRAAPAPLGQMPVEEECGGIEPLGDDHRRHAIAWHLP